MFNAAPVGLIGTISCSNAQYEIRQAAGGSGLQLARYVQSSSAPAAKIVDAPPSVAAIPNQTQVTPNNPPDTAIDILALYSEATRQHFDPGGGKAVTVQFAQHCVDFTGADGPEHDELAARSAGDCDRASGRGEGGFPNRNIGYNSGRKWLTVADELKNLRNFWAADAVVYLIENGGRYYGTSHVPGSTVPSGLPYPLPGPGFAPYAVAVVQRNTAVLDETGTYPQEPYVFMHELAHLIGANHDHEDENNTTPLESGAFGKWAPHADGGGQRTVMSYWRPVAQCTAPCTRVPYYFNPDIYAYDDWFKTGTVNYADNARVIQDYASYMAQYRASLGRIFYDGFDDYSP